MLIALRRIINPAVSLEWQRLLWTGLLASLLLHALAFDLWRGRGVAMPESRGVLSVRLRAVPVPDLVARPLEPVRPAPAVRPVETSPLAEAAQVMRTLPAPVLQPVAPQVDAVLLAEPASLNQEPGLRPLNLAEAKVAYRLALLAAQAPPVTELPAEGMLLELSLTADGRVESLRSVRSPSTLSDPAWLDWLEQAAARASLPVALRGQASRIEIELLP